MYNNRKTNLRFSELDRTAKLLNIVLNEESLRNHTNYSQANFSPQQSKYSPKQSDRPVLEFKRKHIVQNTAHIKQEYYSPSLFKKGHSNEKSLEKAMVADSNDKIKLRSTFSANNLIHKLEQPAVTQDKKFNPTSTFFSLRKSMNPSQRTAKQKQQRPLQLKNLENTLNYLQNRVNHAKRELEKKKQKRIKIDEKKVILENYEGETEQGNFQKPEESQISVAQSTNTVKKPPVQLRISSLVTSMPRPKQWKGFDENPYSPRKHNIYYVSEMIRAVNEKNSIAREHIASSIKILKMLQNLQIPNYAEVEERKLNLKRKQIYKDKKTLVFDLDQTLIHCTENLESQSDVKLKINFGPGEEIVAGINIRPHALSMLNQLSKNYQLMIFTASHSTYADTVLDYLDPDRRLFQHRMYREHCYHTENGMYIKDLRIINRNLSDLVLIDNAAYSYAFQLQNGIPILPYYQGSNDFELKALKSYLDKILVCKDVREMNKKVFKLHHYTKFNHAQQLIEQLYMNS